MPGIFAIFCAHGICLAFFFMSKFESTETLFSFIMQRRRIAPKMLIYDDMCHGHGFALNREPWFFNTVWFLIPIFHQKDHVACSNGYCLSLYPHLNCLNGEVAEEMFSIVDRITTPVSYMRVENATYFVRFFFALQNAERRLYWSGNTLRSSTTAALQRQKSLDDINMLLATLS